MDILEKLEYVRKRISNHLGDFNNTLKYNTEKRLDVLLDEVDVILKDDVCMRKKLSELMACHGILGIERVDDDSISNMKNKIRSTLRSDYSTSDKRKITKNTESHTYLIKTNENAKQPIFIQMIIDTYDQTVIDINLIK